MIMSDIDAYDWTHIFEDADFSKEAADILYEWTNDDREGYFCGVVRNSHTNTYYSFSAWHDYTGWDCQSGVEWFGPYDSVMGAVSQLAQEDRRNLGFEHSPIPEDIYRDYEA
jgi:hypothetical protein